jgi:hypothetical protein
MKTCLTLLLILSLTSCATPVPIKPKFPAVPESISEPCIPLNKLQGEVISIVDLHKVIVENYTLYYECSTKVEAWNEWYSKQKKVYDEVK